MVLGRLWRVLTLESSRKASQSKSESMGAHCSKSQSMEHDDNLDDILAVEEKRDTSRDAFVPVGEDDDHPVSAGSKRNRSDGKRPSFRRSLFRVNSRSDRSSGDPFDDIPGSPRARASTYTHVHDAVMYNLSEAERSKHDKSVPMGVIGLRNLGNTCFINSSLQCLSATIPLTDYFLGYDYRPEINKDNFLGTGGKLVAAYAELMKKMWLGSKSVVEPDSFKDQLSTFAPQFSGYHQHDSQELLAYLLDGIHEDLNRVKSRPYVEDKDCDGSQDEQDAIDAWKNYLKRNKSLVVDLFQGQLRNTCKCLECGHVNIRFEPFMYLSLPISENAKSLDDCIDIYLQKETLRGADQWYCEKCKKHVDATKKSDLWIVPPILIVHLKRFKYNDFGKVGSKNDQPISYPVNEWDLKKFMTGRKGIYPVYDLYAVSNHMGSLGGGHYTATTLNRFDDVWYEFNDSQYRTVSESIHESQKKSAYVLFYNRSEGDNSVPLNERSPLIRRQSVSRPDLWPHTQMDDRSQVRNFKRSSRKEKYEGLFGPLETLKSRNVSPDEVAPSKRGVPASVAATGKHPGGPALHRPTTNGYQTRSRTGGSQDPDGEKVAQGLPRRSGRVATFRHGSDPRPDPRGRSPSSKGPRSPTRRRNGHKERRV